MIFHDEYHLRARSKKEVMEFQKLAKEEVEHCKEGY